MDEERFPNAAPEFGCPICGHSTPVPVLAKNGYTIACCAACSVLHVSPIPSNEMLQAHYQDPSYFSGPEEQGYQSYSAMRKALIPHFKRRLAVVRSQVPTGGRLLDFGCAAGYFLDVARSEGWQIAGVELSQEMARRASDMLSIPIASSLDSLPDGDFDAICLWEVIEHLPRPIAELRLLRDRLRPGGLLMLSTPNTGHWQAKRQPDGWIGYRPPSHLVFFDERTLADALARAGFDRVTITRVSPLPPLPNWLRDLTAPLQRGLSTGQARAWPVALMAWRATRLLGWGWQMLRHPGDDIFATLEAVAFRSA